MKICIGIRVRWKAGIVGHIKLQSNSVRHCMLVRPACKLAFETLQKGVVLINLATEVCRHVWPHTDMLCSCTGGRTTASTGPCTRRAQNRASRCTCCISTGATSLSGKRKIARQHVTMLTDTQTTAAAREQARAQLQGRRIKGTVCYRARAMRRL